MTSIAVKSGDATIDIPATHETLSALAELQRAFADRNPREPGEKTLPEVLLILPNEDGVDAEGEFARARPPGSQPLPACLSTRLMPHQIAGLEWLQKAWSIGRPGVLLADDMGLGKTLQGLAFLAWLREGMSAGLIARKPVLIVAPTGLLQNWVAEHDRHLSGPGLGRLTEAFGKGLSKLKRHASDGRPALDTTALSGSDWVATTYETLRDFDRDFGTIRFSAIVFDEAQKIKTPGARVTDAAKAMNADFRIAMTGTPVENQLSDLWCITDAVHPALLGDLKGFSARYERDLDVGKLKTLKLSLVSRPGVLECRACRRQSGLLVGTVMERSHTPLSVWFWAAYLVASQTPGMSAVQFQRQLGLTRYETAFGILHKLRAGMVRPDKDRIGGRAKEHVEVDEAWVGGKTRGEGRGVHHKTLVAAAVEVRRRKPGTAQDKRKDGRYAGRVRLAIAVDRSADSLCGFVEKAVTPGSMIVTDDWSGYASLRKRGYDHHAIAESGDPEIAEQFMPMIHLVFSNLKTWLNGIHHGVSAKHLQAYLNEYTFRFNRRFYPFNAFRSLLGIAGGVEAPTYADLYSGAWKHPTSSGCLP